MSSSWCEQPLLKCYGGPGKFRNLVLILFCFENLTLRLLMKKVRFAAGFDLSEVQFKFM